MKTRFLIVIMCALGAGWVGCSKKPGSEVITTAVKPALLM